MKGVLKVSKEKVSWLKITNMAYIIEYEKMVLKCKYEIINHLHDNVYTAKINGVQNKFNSEGNRL